MTKLRPMYLAQSHSDSPAANADLALRDEPEEDEEDEEDEEEDRDEEEDDGEGYSE